MSDKGGACIGPASTGPAMHYVCTHDEARALIDARQSFWVCNCGCREARGGCARSRIDVCLWFGGTGGSGGGSSGSDKRAITRGHVETILEEAKEKNLVSRPFREMEGKTVLLGTTDGICFCCDDCCGYFLNPAERCDRGAFVERTYMALCNDCLACVDVCRFGARRAAGRRLAIDHDSCYGCGLCVTTCPTDGIAMVPRG